MNCEIIVAENDKGKAIDVLQRVTLAVEALCVGKGDVRSRLEDALTYYLAPLLERDFPTEVQGKFREIMQSGTKYDASDLDKRFPLPRGLSHNQREGRIHSTMRRIRRRTGAKIARDLWDLYIALIRIARS